METPSRELISETLRQDLHDLYRVLHQTPELSMQESETALLIERRMQALGYDTFRCGDTGVVAVLRNSAGPVVAFRADIDGLPVAEETGLPYQSSARGTLPDGTDVPVMHACGHDMHVACAIGAASLLMSLRSRWAGTVVFLFQPGEETAQGALNMVTNGLWENTPIPEVIYSQHVWTGPAGQIELTEGPAMAMADGWKVVVIGRGGHAARPEDTIDPVLLAAHMVVRIQSVVSREMPAQASGVVTVATLHAGHKDNIIPSSAEFTINFRSGDEATRTLLFQALRRVIFAEAAASNALEPLIEEVYRFPLLFNDPIATREARIALCAAFGSDNVQVGALKMASEDFGILADSAGVPGVYWFFGGTAEDTSQRDGPTPVNHSPFYAPVMEPTLTTGVTAAFTAIMSRVAV